MKKKTLILPVKLLKNIFAKTSRPRIEITDPLVGLLVSEEGSGLWQTEPVANMDNTAVCFYGTSDGICEKQRKSFIQLESDFSALSKLGLDYVTRNADWKIEEDKLRTYGVLVLDEDDDTDFVIEYTEPDEIVVHRVDFKDGLPTEWGFDD